MRQPLENVDRSGLHNRIQSIVGAHPRPEQMAAHPVAANTHHQAPPLNPAYGASAHPARPFQGGAAGHSPSHFSGAIPPVTPPVPHQATHSGPVPWSPPLPPAALGQQGQRPASPPWEPSVVPHERMDGPINGGQTAPLNPDSLPELVQTRVEGGRSRPADLSFQSMRKYLYFAYTLIGILVFLVGGWAYMSQIKGAVIASGKVGIEGRPQIVQHETGGVISEILVTEGNRVEAGQALIRLDPTVIDFNLAAAETRFFEAAALVARLESESAGRNSILWPKTLRAARSNPRAKQAMQIQSNLFSAYRDTNSGQIQQIEEKLRGLRSRNSGIESEIRFALSELNMVEAELAKQQSLFAQGLILRSRVVDMDRERSNLQNKLAQLQSERQGLQLDIQNSFSEMEQSRRVTNKDVLNDLRRARLETDGHFERLQTLRAQQEKIEIKAPATGVIHKLAVSTTGGVILSGEEIMQIIPVSDLLLIEAKVKTQDIDQITIGQSSIIVFSAIDLNVPPELNGQVSRISANSLSDASGGEEYYSVEITIPETERIKLQGQPLVAGMPANVFIQTTEKSVLDYLTAPVRDALGTSMRDGR